MATFCKCKSACTTKRKENSSRGCLCKGRNVLCTDECQCGTNNKPCRNRVCMHLKLNTFTSFVIELPKSVRNNLCILFRTRMSSRHLPMKAVEFEPSLSAIAFGTCFFRSLNATLSSFNRAGEHAQTVTVSL